MNNENTTRRHRGAARRPAAAIGAAGFMAGMILIGGAGVASASVDVPTQQPPPTGPRAIVIGDPGGDGPGPKTVVIGDPGGDGPGPNAIVITDNPGDGHGPRAVVIPGSGPPPPWQRPK